MKIYQKLLLIGALLLQALPLSSPVAEAKPDFVLLSLIYGSLHDPRSWNVGTAFFAGILMDLLIGNKFGQFAFSYVITIFIVVIFQRRVILFNSYQQLISIFALLSISQTIIAVLGVISGKEFPNYAYWLSIVVGTVLWGVLTNRFFQSHN